MLHLAILQILYLFSEFPYNFSFLKGQWLIPNFVLTSISGNAENQKNDQGFQCFNFSVENSNNCEFAVEFYESGLKNRTYTNSFDVCANQSAEAFQKWIANYPKCNLSVKDVKTSRLKVVPFTL